MGNVNGQDSNSLFSKRLKKITSERQALNKRSEQPNSIVTKIEKVLFAYRETLAYYQDLLEQYEVDFKNNVREVTPQQGISVVANELKNLTDQLMSGIQELENIVQRVSIISMQGASEHVAATTSTIPDEYETSSREAQNVLQLEEYNTNLTEIKKRLEDLMKFVGKVDGSIIENLKSHTNANQEEVVSMLMELKVLTQKRNKGVKPLLIFNLIFGVLNVGGIVFLILEYLGIIQL